MPDGEDNEKIFSVGALTRSIRKNLLENNEKIAGVWIEGEISGWKQYPSGHVYFTLKDADAQISAVLFSFHANGCDVAFAAVAAEGAAAVNGLKVQVTGELDLNMSRGQYSFKVFRMRMAGTGDKMAQFNALKARIEAEGLNKLDHPELRRPFPFLPHRIGIVTSPAGAVIHDMCQVLTRRFPNIEIRLYPVKVQGTGASEDVAAGVAYFNSLAADPSGWRPDLIIVGRGGGAVEDLWAFNEEPAVYAVAGSAVPVISAVGHESDTTLCDYVADMRAGTPSMAAERAVPVKAELEARVADASSHLARVPMRRVETWLQQLDYLSHQLGVAPREALSDAAHRLDSAAARLVPALKEMVVRMEMRRQRVVPRLGPPLRIAWQDAVHRLERASSRLKLLDPSGVMARGYSITFDADGRVVQSAAAVSAGQVLTTRLKDGELKSNVLPKG